MPERSATACLETPPGKGGIAVVSLSGPDATLVAREVFLAPSDSQPVDGQLLLGHIVEHDQPIDQAILARTGDSFEINIHGGPAAVMATLKRLASSGCQIVTSNTSETFDSTHPKWNNPAIGSEMLTAISQARSVLALSAITNQWSGGLSELASNSPSADQLRHAAGGLVRMRRLLEPAEVVLAGQPNVGKSTLANLLTARQVSIVHDTAGTTRDWVREIATVEGIPIWPTDTAGLWDAPDHIDAQAVSRARQCIENADLVVLMSAGDDSTTPNWLDRTKLLRVATKCDIVPAGADADISISCETGDGIDQLCSAIAGRIGLATFDASIAMAFTQRQADLLDSAADALEADDTQPASKALQILLAG